MSQEKNKDDLEQEDNNNISGKEEIKYLEEIEQKIKDDVKSINDKIIKCGHSLPFLFGGRRVWFFTLPQTVHAPG